MLTVVAGGARGVRCPGGSGLEQQPSLVAHLGIDEHRCGWPRFACDEAARSMCCKRTAGTRAYSTCPEISGC